MGPIDNDLAPDSPSVAELTRCAVPENRAEHGGEADSGETLRGKHLNVLEDDSGIDSRPIL